MKNILRKAYTKIKTVDKKKLLRIFMIVIMVMICFLHSLSAGHYVDFFPINGTFQNYNPIRRLLSGQVPYLDFIDYLGLGHLYFGAIFTFIFGNNFQASLIAFSFLTMLSAILISIALGRSILGKKESAYVLTIAFLMLILIQPLFYSFIAGTKEINDALDAVLSVGNSARFIRGMILPLCCMFFYFGLHFWTDYFKKYHVKNKMLLVIATISLGTGFAFIWSNDYGISCWLCATIMFFVIEYSRSRRFLKTIGYTILEVIFSIVSVLVWAVICTRGHAGEWIFSTFGTGNYQSWYYNSSKSYYFWDVDFSYIMLVQALICLIYLGKLYLSHGTMDAVKRYGIPAFANMTCFCAVNEYRLLSGGEAREVALTVLFLTMYFELIRFASSLTRKEYFHKMICIIVLIISMAWILSTAKEEMLFAYVSEKDGDYVPQLGGNLTTLYNDLYEAQEFLNGDNFFATYASAQEVMSGSYQPSGIDYIIHVLGDKQREKYLDSFKNDDFRYAATIKASYSTWEYWIRRANWFFYRELYSEWHPVWANSYEIYWERNETEGENTLLADAELSVVDVDESTKKIVITTDRSVNGIADVYLQYEVKKKDNNSAKFLYQKVLYVANTGSAEDTINFLRDQGDEYVPIPIIDGYGEITLIGYPTKSTFLEVEKAVCSEIYTVMSDYVEINNVVDNGDTVLLFIPKTDSTEIIIQGAKSLMIDSYNIEIADAQIEESDIVVSIKKDKWDNISDILLKGRFVKIVKE